MKKLRTLIYVQIMVLILIFSTPHISASANSQNYSVNLFGTGMATGNPSSTTHDSIFLSEPKATTRNAESQTYTGNIGFFENSTYHRTVSITSYSISPTSATTGSTIELSLSALNSQAIWAKITSPNNQEEIINLINGQATTYLPSPSVIGTYEVVFYANSSTGAVASIIDYFELTEQSPATPPSGGGGGGSSGGGSTTTQAQCSYNWDCTPWSICLNEKQTRTCTNIGTCKGSENKPLETIECSQLLFDITLDVKQIRLTENKFLIFDIELIEQIGLEKVDAHIKYSIIDEDNNEIFSQIETKAIQEKLNYEKELSEATLEEGKYTLRVDILYGNLQRAYAEQKFEIKDGQININLAKGLTGAAITDPTINKIVTNILGIVIGIVIIGAAIFLYKKKGKKYAKKIKRKIKPKYSKDSLKGLIKKKVYTEEGENLGVITGIILKKNKINSLRIELNKIVKKENGIRKKNILIKYNYVRSVGKIAIVDSRILENLIKK